jgi:hypothetical protein
MPASAPKKVVIEFDGGVKKEASFDALPGPLRTELLRQPFASLPSSDPSQDKFVLLEWDDGYKQVIAVDPRCTAINRYTVITRPEDVGRLSLNMNGDFPELIEVGRKPLNLKRVTFGETVQVSLDKSEREGRKFDHFFTLTRDGDARAEQAAALKKAAADEGIDLKQLKPHDTDTLEKLRRKMGLKGERQQDVFDFLIALAK